MIISRTPMRISFVGGATDIKNYYSRYGGEVVSCAIDKYIYVTLNKRDDEKIVACYSKVEQVDSVDEIQHPIIREALKMAKITKGVEIHIIAKISTIGTGLGGSSAIAVGLLHCLFPDKSQMQIAEMACELEINRLGKEIGKQDQYACAVGGLNHIYFRHNGTVDINEIAYSGALLGSMFMKNVSQTNDRGRVEDLLKKQNENFEINLVLLHRIKELCRHFRNALTVDHKCSIVRLLNEYWQLKKCLSHNVSNENIDTQMNEYINLGCGVKLCGAGNGGYIFIYSPDSKCEGAMPVKIDYKGTILMKNF